MVKLHHLLNRNRHSNHVMQEQNLNLHLSQAAILVVAGIILATDTMEAQAASTLAQRESAKILAAGCNVLDQKYFCTVCNGDKLDRILEAVCTKSLEISV